MTPPKSEKTVLRTELRHVWGVVEILLGALAGSVGMTRNALKVIIDEMAQLGEENLVLRGTIKKMEQRIRIHESWNHSHAEATEYARNRRQFRNDAKEYRVKRMQAPHDQMQRKAGHRHGMPGVSHHDRPCDGRREFAADMCRQCGRTDLVLDAPIQKMTRKLAEGRIVFLQYAITCGACPDCKVVTYPHTYIIPGTSFGKKLMATIVSYKNESVSVKGMTRLIRDVFGAHISAGAVSNCTSAKINPMKGSVLKIHSKTVILKHDDTELFYSSLCPPPEASQSIYDYDAQIARHSTVWTSFMPLPAMVKILEKSTMEPWYRTNESRQQIGKKEATISPSQSEAGILYINLGGTHLLQAENLLVYSRGRDDQASLLEHIRAPDSNAKRDYCENSRRVTWEICQDHMFGDLSLYMATCPSQNHVATACTASRCGA